jgi:hypothetical protein
VSLLGSGLRTGCQRDEAKRWRLRFTEETDIAIAAGLGLGFASYHFIDSNEGRPVPTGLRR